MGYLANFIVYTLAMAGVMAIALLIFKNATSAGGNHKSKCLKVLDTMSLAPRKTLYIVAAGKEKFLIAGDVDKTTLISKLETREEFDFKPDISPTPKIGIQSSLMHTEKSVMRNLADRIKVKG